MAGRYGLIARLTPPGQSEWSARTIHGPGKLAFATG